MTRGRRLESSFNSNALLEIKVYVRIRKRERKNGKVFEIHSQFKKTE
jgi:hypothetical protein